MVELRGRQDVPLIYRFMELQQHGATKCLHCCRNKSVKNRLEPVIYLPINWVGKILYGKPQFFWQTLPITARNRCCRCLLVQLKVILGCVSMSSVRGILLFIKFPQKCVLLCNCWTEKRVFMFLCLVQVLEYFGFLDVLDSVSLAIYLLGIFHRCCRVRHRLPVLVFPTLVLVVTVYKLVHRDCCC